MLTLSFSQPLLLLCFVVFIGIALMLDLGVFSRTLSNPTFKESIIRTIVWASLGLLFSVLIYYFYADFYNLNSRINFENYRSKFGGDFLTKENIADTRTAFSKEVWIQYLSGYFVEYSLSLDNLFVMMLIFKSFKVHHFYERKILFWGVLGAIIMRFLFIFIGGALIARFAWVLYIFGAFLIYSGAKLLFGKEDGNETMDTENHPVVKFASKIFRITNLSSAGNFFMRINGKTFVTSLFIVLLVIEFSDVVFAVDSVPAIFGITKDPYLVFFSNIFAILGLRSLYFLLGHGMKKFRSLQYGLSLILIYIGAKMIFENWLESVGFTHLHNLFVLLLILSISVLFTFILPEKNTESK